ncbi:hypothetical protein BRADI_1g49281v3 [Brachypodium distachyon]|uniref:Uncharacterized protein n=1 Tax=Brachypodium distachyon TaxID=15368 RepID=A0A2K2DQI3_BRADI|nr:hypothetical protein BRADI_1g49281v3 [Brachypodium distachyon]
MSSHRGLNRTLSSFAIMGFSCSLLQVNLLHALERHILKCQRIDHVMELVHHSPINSLITLVSRIIDQIKISVQQPGKLHRGTDIQEFKKEPFHKAIVR